MNKNNNTSSDNKQDVTLANAGVTSFFQKEFSKYTNRMNMLGLQAYAELYKSIERSSEFVNYNTKFKDKDIDYFKNLITSTKYNLDEFSRKYNKYPPKLKGDLSFFRKEFRRQEMLDYRKNNRINLDFTSDNVFRRIMDSKNILYNSENVFTNMFWSEQNIEVKSFLQNKYSDNNIVKAKAINRFVDTMKESPTQVYFRDNDGDNIYKKEMINDVFKDTGFSNEEIKKVLADYQTHNQKTAKRKKKYINDKNPIFRTISDKMINPSEMIEQYGIKQEGENLVSVKDLIENRNKFTGQDANINSNVKINMIDELRDLAKKNPEIENMVVDKNLRFDEYGNIYSTKDFEDLKKKAKLKMKNSPLAKALKLDELLKDDKTNFEFFSKGSNDRILSAIESKDGKIRKLQHNYYFINNKFYRESKGRLIEDEKLKDYKVISSRDGVAGDLLKSLMGEGKGAKANQSFFDVRTKFGPSKTEKITDYAKQRINPEWEGNILKTILDDNELVLKLRDNVRFSVDEYDKYAQRLSTINKMFKDSSIGISRDGVKALKNRVGSKETKILSLLEDGAENALNKLSGVNVQNIKNRDLAGLITSYIRDKDSVLSRIEKKSNNLLIGESKDILDIDGILNREVIKEVLLSSDEDVITDILKSQDFSDGDKGILNRLKGWGEFQKATGASGYKSDYKDEDTLRGSMNRLYNMITNDDSVVKNELEKITKERFSLNSKNTFDKDKFGFGTKYEDKIVIKKAVSILDALNSETKAKAFFKQFTAGADNPEDITTATLIPYYFANKLNKSLDSIGLGLSGKDASSTGELLLNLGVKRALPAMLGIKALSYLDYRMEAYTGRSLKGSAANILAGADLGTRKILDTTGVSDNFRSQREYNPILRYIFGDKYMDTEERREWYRDGKTPVRSGRYWSFMSLNEFRGGKIDYFQPNWFNRAHSNAYDASVYGSTKEKWKYSWLPTPRHPLAPLRRLLDPYRLERRNYMDRPYHKSGPAFGHEVPGSALLNMTVGNLIKPGTAMHTATTNRRMLDSRSIIEQENARIREQATSNLIKLNEDGDIVPATYHSLKPFGTQDVNIRIEQSKINIKTTRHDTIPGIDINDFKESYESVVKSKHDLLKTGTIKPSGKISLSDVLKQEVRSNIGNPFLDIQDQYERQESMATNEINRANKEILEKSSEVGKAGVVTKDGLPSSGPGVGQLFDSQTLSDLRNTTSTDNYLRDLRNQTTGMMGLHGFALNKIFKKDRYSTLADSSAMESSSRRFWDMSLGGLGGRPAHALRKLFPHEDHTVNRVNTIRNTMPEWLPDRFKYGDPYILLPKGEMRLPGRGYESMNELNPDEYGELYGSFDRMKILADIAPWSTEYKIWREVAEREVQDPHLRREMDRIKDRVEEQSKRHDFYHYRFLGQKVDSREVTIEEVFNGNQFKVRGDDQIYRLGKIDQVSEEAGQLFHAGMTVRMQTGRDESDDVEAKAAVIYHNGVNINRSLLKNRLATEGKTESAMDARATLTSSQVAKGKVWEAIAHADIPIIHKKFLNINDPLESYKQERIYGKNHSTWSKPFKGWIAPAFRESYAVGPVRHALGLGAWYLAEHMMDEGVSSNKKIASLATLGILNKGAMAGGIIASIPNMGFDADTFMKGARAGAAVQAVGYTIANRGSVFKSVTGLGTIGAILGNQLFSSKYNDAALKGGKYGALAGLLLAGYNTSIFNKGYNRPYVPEELKKRWEIEEYFDRLSYVRYRGLFERASRLAKRHEGVDIKSIVQMSDREQKKNEKIREELVNSRQKVSNIYSEGDPEGDRLRKEIDHKIAMLDTPESIVQGGQYTKMAVAYKQAMDSTIYALNENSNWTQILRALPKNERDYMLEFAKEQDPKKRKEIYQLVSPYQRKVLDIAWGRQIQEKQRSNFEYFMNHNIANSFWSGWKSTTDMEAVKMNVIHNEGLLLSDFGGYESQLSDRQARNAASAIPSIKSTPLDSIGNVLKFTSAMKGAGLGVDGISITPTSGNRIEARVNVLQSRTQELKREVSRQLGLPNYG